MNSKSFLYQFESFLCAVVHHEEVRIFKPDVMILWFKFDDFLIGLFRSRIIIEVILRIAEGKPKLRVLIINLKSFFYVMICFEPAFSGQH